MHKKAAFLWTALCALAVTVRNCMDLIAHFYCRRPVNCLRATQPFAFDLIGIRRSYDRYITGISGHVMGLLPAQSGHVTLKLQTGCD